ncbi:hypothetical protein E2C01_075326 [Portunus trituberculatus]|uniref:Uncharacterized protein n=1 Tax=Portunus trituberculatus TaxID=210409 RepID=A0A5B7IFV4_PORTR|nr:hypothetical protein [Portunus trituberculatus]
MAGVLRDQQTNVCRWVVSACSVASSAAFTFLSFFNASAGGLRHQFDTLIGLDDALPSSRSCPSPLTSPALYLPPAVSKGQNSTRDNARGGKHTLPALRHPGHSLGHSLPTPLPCTDSLRRGQSNLHPFNLTGRQEAAQHPQRPSTLSLPWWALSSSRECHTTPHHGYPVMARALPVLFRAHHGADHVLC